MIVDACADEARKTAFCLSTDATGVAIQPEPLAGGGRQACQKGHFFVVLADKDHVFFEYKTKHTSDAVCEMFRGFSGYIQADAHCTAPRTPLGAVSRGRAVVCALIGRPRTPICIRPRSTSSTALVQGIRCALPGSDGCWSIARRARRLAFVQLDNPLLFVPRARFLARTPVLGLPSTPRRRWSKGWSLRR